MTAVRISSGLIVSYVMLMAGSPVVAQNDEVATIKRPFLWEVTPPDSNIVSYLFGTIHVNDPKITKLHPLVQSAFDRSTAAWFEIDFVKDAAKQTQAISMAPGKRLQDLVSAETIARIDTRLKNLSPLLSRGSLPEFQVVMWPMILANLEAQVKHLGTLPMDMQMQITARQAGKKSGGLEDAASQLQPLMDLPLEKQIEFLEASLDVMDEDQQNGVNSLDVLVRLYADGSSEPLQGYLQKELQRPKVSDEVRTLFVDTLLIARNRQMAKGIQKVIQEDPSGIHFVAVGTAHLLGEGSVQDELTALGFQVKRVNPDSADNAD
jgi:uncharacterized protein YbaP (TraB family)